MHTTLVRTMHINTTMFVRMSVCMHTITTS